MNNFVSCNKIIIFTKNFEKAIDFFILMLYNDNVRMNYTLCKAYSFLSISIRAVWMALFFIT